jgi:hypothetical protein
MRSNDVWLGAAYDFFQFTRVQIAMASVLGIQTGTYAHHVGSLHIYEQHYDAAESLQHTSDPYENIPHVSGSTWSQVQNRAMGALTAAMHKEERALLYSLHPFEQWYASAMIRAIEKNEGK